MGLTKSEQFTDKQNELANLAKVLGHPARIAILEYLFKQKNCFCGSLVDVIGLAQPTISQHLKELKKQNLIQGKILGTSVCYCINHEKWNEMSDLFAPFFNKKPTL